jgi:tetratricopeptide (TPR) repeat protein
LERLSGLPLALTQAAAYISQTAVSIVQYLEYYDSMWQDLMEQQDGYPLQEYAQRSVLTTWKISYEQVKSQSEEASNLLQLWSLLYAGDLWYELIACAKELGAETSVPSWLTVLAQNRLKFDRALALLIKYSLVEGRTETASYAMHSVLHSWCRYLGRSEVERDSFRDLAVHIVGVMVPSESTEEYWILQKRLLPHGQMILNGMKSKTTAAIDVNETGVYEDLAGMFADQDRYMEAEAICERVLAGYEKALGAEHTDTLMTVNNLANLYSDQGKLVGAEQMYKRALAGYEKALGAEHRDTLMTVNNLGTLYSNQGKLAEAEQMYKRALAGYEKALGPEHTSTLSTVNNLGVLYKAQGKLAEAEQMYKRALAGYEKAFGPEHTDTLGTVNNLGMLYKAQGKLAEAEQMYKRALAGFEKALGPEHTSTLSTVNNLASLYSDQGKLVGAEQMYKRALAGKEKALGAEHTSTLVTVNNLGVLYKAQGKLAEAEQMYKRALAGFEKALGAEHTDTLMTVNNLANLYSDQGKLVGAEQMYKRALAGKEKALGSEHKSTIRLAQRLSTLRTVPTKSTCGDEGADNKATVFECPNLRLSHETISPSCPSLGPKLVSQVEQKELRPRKRDAFLRELGLRPTASDTQ